MSKYYDVTVNMSYTFTVKANNYDDVDEWVNTTNFPLDEEHLESEMNVKEITAWEDDHVLNERDPDDTHIALDLTNKWLENRFESAINDNEDEYDVVSELFEAGVTKEDLLDYYHGKLPGFITCSAEYGEESFVL